MCITYVRVSLCKGKVKVAGKESSVRECQEMLGCDWKGQAAQTSRNTESQPRIEKKIFYDAA